MTYGFKFYNTSGEIVLDDDYIKPWFAGKGVPLSVTGPVAGYNSDRYYSITYQTPGIGGNGGFAAITVPNNGGEYWADGDWNQGYNFTVNVYFPNTYTPTSADAPEVYFFSINPVNPRSTTGYGLQLRRADQQCTFDSNKKHFKPNDAVQFNIPFRYATGTGFSNTCCGYPCNQANCSQVINLSNVPTKAAFVLPYFFKTQSYTTGPGALASYLFDFQAVYKRSATNAITARVALRNYEFVDAYFSNYDLTQGSDVQYIIYIDGSSYDVGGGSIEFPAATYSLSASPTSVAEGNNIVVTLTTTGVPNGTSVPWVISGSNITSEDFSLGGVLSGSFTVQNNTASVTIPTTRNDNSEGTETATFSLTNNAASVAFNITNVPFYTNPNITSFSYSPASPDETANSVVAFTINVQDNTVSGAPRDFYWAIEGGTNVTGDDFVGLIYGTLTTENGTGQRTFSITIKQDYATENAQEQFRVNFYTAGPYVGTPFYQSSYITIADTSKDRPTINYFQVKPNSTGTYGSSVTGLSGETPYFKWDVTNATSVTIDNGVGTVASSGTDVALAGAVLNATTWTLTATNQYGSVTSSVTFNVSASTYQLSTSATSINEGGSVTITLTTTNVLNGTQVPYSINNTTFDTSDWSGGALSSSGIFTVNNNTASRTFTSLADVRTDGDKVLTIALTNYPQVTVSTTIVDSSTCPAANTLLSSQCLANYVERKTYYTGNYSGGVCTTYNIDTSNSVACGYVSYSITPSATNIVEGNSVTFTVNTTNVANGTVLYWTNSGTVGTSQGTVTITTSGSYGTGSFTISTTVSSVYDGGRSIIANLRTGGYSGTIVATASTVTVADAPTSWSLSQSSTSITEGGSITYTITTTNLVTPAAGIYWEQIGTAGSGDMSATSGTIGADGNGIYSLTISTNVDPVYNTTLKTVQIRFRNINSSGTILATSQSTTLNNAAPTYSITVNPASVNETTSALATFTITTTNVQNGTTLYWINTGTIIAADFTDNTNSGTVTVTNNSATFTRTIARDQAYEGQENIVMEVRTTAGGTAVASVTVPVADTSQLADWEVLGPSDINEGNSAEYVVTGTQYVATWGTTRVYLSIRHDTTNSSDVNINFTSGRILSSDAGEAAFTVSAVADQLTEGAQQFYLDLRKDSITNGVILSKLVTINDTSLDPVYSNVQINSITWDPASVNEGNCVTFTVNATDNTTSGAPRNFYYAAIGGTNTTGADFSGNPYGTLTSQNGTFTRNFSICIAADQATESSPSPETFSVGIYKTGPYTGTPYYQTASININDTSQTPNPPTIDYFQIKLSGGSYGSSAGSVPYSSNGYTAFFRWSTSNATSVTISGIGGDQGSSGNDAALATGVTTTTNWTLTASNAGGSVSAGVTLYICAAPGSWDGSSYVCVGANKYKTVTDGNCGTTTGDLLQANAYSDCCSQDKTTVLESICITDQYNPQRRRKYHDGYCGYNYTYTPDNDCCPPVTSPPTFLGYTTCSGCVQYPIYAGGKNTNNTTTCLANTDYSAPQPCSMPGYYTGATYCESGSGCTGYIRREYQPANCGAPYYEDTNETCYPGSEKVISNTCSGVTRTITTCNGSGGYSSSSYTDTAGCCAPAGWSGNTQCVYLGGTGYGQTQEFYNDGSCGGGWYDRGGYCCLPYGTALYSYCASANIGNNNKVTVYSGGGSPTGCNNYTQTETNHPDCYVSPPPLSISCSASPSSVAIGGTTTLSWSTTGTCSGTTVEICAGGGCTGVVYPCSGSQSGVGGGVTTPGTITATFTVYYGGYSASCSTDVYFFVPSGGGGGGGGGQQQ